MTEGGLGHGQRPVAKEGLRGVALLQQRNKLSALQGLEAGAQAGWQPADGPRVQKGVCRLQYYCSLAAQTHILAKAAGHTLSTHTPYAACSRSAWRASNSRRILSSSMPAMAPAT